MKLSRTRTLGILTALLASAGIAIAASRVDVGHASSSQTTAAQAGLERLRSLAGEWIALDEDGKPTDEVLSSVRTTAGNSAVVETLFGGTEKEMLTVYYLEGDRLALTHYCVVGNQPHMLAQETDDPNLLVFGCVGGSNVDCATTRHMHSARLRWDGPDRMSTEWRMIEGDAEVHVAAFELARKR